MNIEEKYGLVNSFLEDEISRSIFKERHLYNQDKQTCHIENIVSSIGGEYSKTRGGVYYPGKEKMLIKEVESIGAPIYIYGAGYKGKRIFHLLQEQGIKIEGFFDIRYVEITDIEDTPVFEPTAGRCEGAVIVVSLTNNIIAKEVYSKCLRLGALAVYLFNDYAIHPIGNQYFDFNIINFNKEEVFVDAGAFDLATSIEFKRYCEEKDVEGYIYAFEPDGLSYVKCKEKILRNNYKNIELINSCLWNEKAVLCFDEEGTGSSAVSDNGKAFVQALPLDEIGLRRNVTFIKMDVEGAELKALIGARKTIVKNHPKLAICIYHKPDDIYDIPSYIKELDPSYRLFIRHYSNYITETVLYAV